jgi:phosphatidylinositol dimannoside acyltransferase
VLGLHQVPADRFKLWLSIALARGVSRFFWLFNLKLLYLIADTGALAVYYLFRTYRRNVQSNLRHVMGPDASDLEVERVAKQVFRNSARNFADLMRVPHVSDTELLESITLSPETIDILDRVANSGRGGVVVTAHYGAFDYVGQIFWVRGYTLTFMIARTVPEFIDTAVTYLRGSRGVRLEPVTPGGIRRVLTALKRGGLVGLVADRDFFQSGNPVTFFGARTTLPPGPIRFARDTGAPVIPVFAHRTDNGYRLTADEPFYVSRTDELDVDLGRALERLVGVFERYLRAAPEQWVMFQRVWTDEPRQAVRVFPVGSPLDGQILGRGGDETGPLTQPTLQEGQSPTPAPRRPETGRVDGLARKVQPEP